MSRASRSDAVRNRARVLDAALAVFTAHGAGASTALVARRAGVGAGTVFRHFPTKDELLAAVLAHLCDPLAAAARAGLDAEDPGAAFFAVLERVIDQAATKKAIAGGIAGDALEVRRRGLARGFRDARAQRAAAVRRDVGIDEVMAVLVAVSRATEHAGRDVALRRRTLGVIFDGLRPRRARRAP